MTRWQLLGRATALLVGLNKDLFITQAYLLFLSRE